MIVKSLRLANFRNYTAQELHLPPGLIGFTGDNGQGKTNLLEAICVLATTKSPLVERDKELIRWHERAARLYAEIELSAGRGDARRLEYSWRVEGNSIAREMKIGGVPQSAVASWLGQLQVVAFFPHDLVLLTGEPEERRRFLNLELGKTQPAYFQDVARYRRALQQRNALLRHLIDSRIHKTAPGDEKGTLSEWNRQVVGYGSRILAARARFFAEMTPILSEIHGKLSGLDEPFSVDYLPGLSTLKGQKYEGGPFSAQFNASIERDHADDMRRGITSSGPHRDDLVFKLGDMDLRRYGSQGQQRLAVLSLKVALAHWVEQSTGEPPILLLDDALSELDATRRALLLEEARSFPQSVVTATDATFLSGAAALFSVSSGRVVENLKSPESAIETGNQDEKAEILEDLAVFS
ncbi:MAG TPA: DNA replication/repair protein RecF [Abditibacterium sp.]|jgi:DNA replication and repair protein RecF